MKVFDSKIDTWLLIIVLLAMVMNLFAAMVIIEKQMLRTYFLSAFTITIGVLFSLWVIAQHSLLCRYSTNSLLVKSSFLDGKLRLTQLLLLKKHAIYYRAHHCHSTVCLDATANINTL